MYLGQEFLYVVEFLEQSGGREMHARHHVHLGELRDPLHDTRPGEAGGRIPFGVLGLFYACDPDTLYAGSVLGSRQARSTADRHSPDGAC